MKNDIRQALNPLPFIDTCDFCDQPIIKIRDGWLEWRTDKDGKCFDFKVVHHLPASPRDGGCYTYPRSDNHLRYFAGTDGQDELLELLERARSVEEWIKLFRRSRRWQE